MGPAERVVRPGVARRPWPLRALNAGGRALGWSASLDPAGLERSARRAVRRELGERAFLDPSFREPLDVLAASMDAEARLHPVGRAITRIRLVNLLANRLRLEAALEAHPAILDEPVAAPVVIAGLQRTGTTFLHRLLAAVPGFRALRSWEALQPLPAGPYGGRPSAEGPDPARLRAARQAETALRFMAPDFFAIHPVEAGAPEEDVLLLDNALLSTVPEATLHVPAYAHWLEERDHRPAYRHLRVLLQALQYFGGRGRWVLKTPHHLEHLDALRAVFPDAVVVQTHRDPAVTYASFFSMVWHGRRVFSDHVPAAEVAAHWRRKNARLLARSMAFREGAADAGFLDLGYAALCADPPAAVRSVLDAAGEPWTEATHRAVEAAARAQPAGRHGRHVYALSDFGLSAEGLAPELAPYRERYAAYL